MLNHLHCTLPAAQFLSLILSPLSTLLVRQLLDNALLSLDLRLELCNLVISTLLRFLQLRNVLAAAPH